MDGIDRAQTVPSVANAARGDENVSEDVQLMMKRVLTLLLAAPMLLPPSGIAQGTKWQVNDYDATRAELEGLIERLEDAAASPAYSSGLREEARAAVNEVRTRLSEGDFRTGDRVYVRVEQVEAIRDTFVVNGERELEIPTIEDVSLKGVLRSELEPYLREYIGQYIRDPIVRARSFLRIAVMGEIRQPGFHLLPPQMPLSEALMGLGGPTNRANLTQIRVERADRKVVPGSTMEAALREGRTLGELGVRSGDEIIVPRKPLVSVGAALRGVGLVSGLIWGLSRIF